MSKFKCPCDDSTCEFNPMNHNDGCDRCIASSVEDKEIPKCFFQAAGGDIDTIEDWSFESFAKTVML